MRTDSYVLLSYEGEKLLLQLETGSRAQSRRTESNKHTTEETLGGKDNS
jgi:hypothetical protein